MSTRTLRMGSKPTSAPLRAAAAPLMFCLAACLSQHEPSSSDTATNWLWHCDQNADCRGGSRCLQHVCTFPCTPAASQNCGSLYAMAVCQPIDEGGGVCELPCTSDSLCDGFGRDYHCEDGFCRHAAEPARAGDSRPGLNSIPMTPEGIMTLSDPDVTAGRSAAVGWHADHWTVAWTMGAAGYAEPFPAPRSYPGVKHPLGLRTLDVYPDGRVSALRRTDAELDFVLLLQNQSDQLGLLVLPDFDDSTRTCRFAASDLRGSGVSEGFEFECPWSGAVTAAPVPDSDEWLVAWSTSYGNETSDVLLARYRIGSKSWSAGPWTVFSDQAHGAISLGASGDDAWLAWPSAGLTRLMMMKGAARAASSQPAFSAGALSLDSPTPRASYAFAAAGADTHLFYVDGEALQWGRLDASGANERRLLETSQAFGTSSGFPIAAVRIPERELTVVCYPQSSPTGLDAANRIALVSVNDDGEVVAGPVFVSGEARSQSCALAWSGTQLLVVWWEMALYMAATDYSMYRARIMDVPEAD